jgi:hypothetical protein
MTDPDMPQAGLLRITIEHTLCIPKALSELMT